MKKKLLSVLLAMAMVVAFIPTAFAASGAGGGLDNFARINTYHAGQFSDVNSGDWFYSSVKAAYEYGLVKGNGDGTFNVGGNVTIAETLALACRLSDIYFGGNGDFQQGQPWYQTYVDYAINNGIIRAGEYPSYNAKATRAQFASILFEALPEEALPAINSVTAIPDVSAGASYFGKVLRLYNAGILTGSDAKGTFNPNSNIVRTEVAAIVTRMADPTLRKSVDFKPSGEALNYHAQRLDFSDIKDKGGNFLRLTQYYDRIVVEGSSAAVKKINASIVAAEADFNSNKDAMEEYFAETEVPSGYDEIYDNTVDSRVTNNSDGVFSIMHISEWYAGGVCTADIYGETYDMATGGKMTIAQALNVTDSMARSMIIAAVDKAMRAEPDRFWEAGEYFDDPLTTVSEMKISDFDFYVENGKVYVCFRTYLLGPGASGCFVMAV